ncbi:hypothetical protein AP9108_33400 [Arthrospira sp. PCC 9108]|nr:hypothetical protein AP9108_33400 [Arthrospira sp. PCC 9108]
MRDYQQAIASQTSAIIEVQTNRKHNQELHQDLAEKIQEISWRF